MNDRLTLDQARELQTRIEEAANAALSDWWDEQANRIGFTDQNEIAFENQTVESVDASVKIAFDLSDGRVMTIDTNGISFS